MNYQILFAGLCAVIAANILVAVIARIERKRGFDAFPASPQV
ncbi:MAG: hypothetical protein WBQ20_01130 [Methyloceanibacter sp.]